MQSTRFAFEGVKYMSSWCDVLPCHPPISPPPSCFIHLPLASTSLNPFPHFTSLPSQFTFISSNKQFLSTNQTNRPSSLTVIFAFASTKEKEKSLTSLRTWSPPHPPLPSLFPSIQRANHTQRGLLYFLLHQLRQPPHAPIIQYSPYSPIP